jgi:hypothetical protein
MVLSIRHSNPGLIHISLELNDSSDDRVARLRALRRKWDGGIPELGRFHGLVPTQVAGEMRAVACSAAQKALRDSRLLIGQQGGRMARTVPSSCVKEVHANIRNAHKAA